MVLEPSCALREKCTTAWKSRTVVVHAQATLLREVRRDVESPIGRVRLWRRITAEHGLARTQATQGFKSRCVGMYRNAFDLRREAAVANLLEIHHTEAD